MTAWGVRAKCGCQMKVTVGADGVPRDPEFTSTCMLHGGVAKKPLRHSCGCLVDYGHCRTDHIGMLERRHQVDVNHGDLAKLRAFLEHPNGSWSGGQGERLTVHAGGAACVFYTDPRKS